MLPVCPLVHTHKWIGMYSIVNKVKITMEQSDDEFGLFGVAEKIERMKYQAAKGAGSTKDWPLKLFFFFFTATFQLAESWSGAGLTKLIIWTKWCLATHALKIQSEEMWRQRVVVVVHFKKKKKRWRAVKDKFVVNPGIPAHL